MEKTNDIPAFPQTIDDMGTLRSRTEGMSLRDWYAGQALSGKLSNPEFTKDVEIYRNIPFRCFEIADAMLAERSKCTS